MSTQINHEMLLFFHSLGIGAFLALLYSVLKALRKLFPRSMFFLSLEDLLFWTGSGFFIFCRIYQENDGIVRFYVVAAIFCGAVLWKTTAESKFITIILRVLEFPVKCLRILIKRLLFWGRSCRILMVKSLQKLGVARQPCSLVYERIRKRERCQRAKQSQKK